MDVRITERDSSVAMTIETQSRLVQLRLKLDLDWFKPDFLDLYCVFVLYLV